jgi:ribosomal protein S18 acetylase RimI-like enzyme
MCNANEGGDVTIRSAKPSDLKRMLAITQEVFGPVSIDRMIEDKLGPAGARWIDIKGAAVSKELNNNPAGAFVAELDGQIVGYLTTTVDAVASRGVINNIAISHKAQGKGLGRRMLNVALDHFRSLKLSHAKIETLTVNEVGQRLYPSLGFEEVARQIHYVMKL